MHSATTSAAQPTSRTSAVLGPMDVWLHTKKADVQITRATEILASVDVEVSEAITA